MAHWPNRRRQKARLKRVRREAAELERFRRIVGWREYARVTMQMRDASPDRLEELWCNVRAYMRRR